MSWQDDPIVEAKSYDTRLDPAQEKAYRVWMNRIGHTKDAGYRIDDNFSGQDYDYRGFFQKNGPVAIGQGQHFPDEFKKPAHETFSNESRYAVGEDAAKAGSWNGEQFTPAQNARPAWMDDPVVDQQAVATSAAAEPVDNRRVGDLGSVIMEPLGVLGTSAVAAPIAGLAGLGAAGTRALGLTEAEPADVVRSVQGALTYQPKTQAGELAAEYNPIALLGKAIGWLGEQAGDATARVTGSPAAGAAVNTATQFAPALLVPALRGRGKPATVEPDGIRSSAPVDRPVAPAQAQAQAAVSSERPAGLAAVAEAEVAPDLVLQTETRAARAKQYVESLGVSWAGLPDNIKATLADVAGDAKNLSKLDPAAMKRQLELESLPVRVPATRGQLTRDPVQLRNEGNVSATKAGEPIRQVYLDQNQALIDNLDVLKGRVSNKQKPAETPEQVGMSVQDQALRAKLQLSKENVSKKYKAAEAAGEMQGKVSPGRIIKAIRSTPDTTHFGWVETWLSKAKVIEKTDSGTVTRKLTLKEMEDLRQAAVAKAMDGGTEGYYAGKVISAIDQATEGAGGKLYKEARAARKAQALEFEETGAVARLVENKSRTDRATALEDTWRKTVIGGSIDDLRNVKRSLLTGGDAKTRAAGKRAWRDLKAQTIQHIRDEATKSVATNERGAPNVTPAAMKRAIDSIGKDKLNEIFGQGTAARLERILEATRTVKTVPPAGHAGSSTMSNILAFLERGLNRLPVVGDIGAGTISTVARLKQMGEAGRLAREAQRTPLAEAEKQSRRNAPLNY